MSGEVPIPESIQEFKTREEFNKWKDKQKSFTSVANRNYQFVKNKYGIVATKKELDEVKRNTKLAQRLAKEKVKDVIKKNPDIQQRMKQMAQPSNLTGISVPNDFEFDNIATRSQFEKRMKNMEDRANQQYYDERMEQLKDNFIKALEKNFHSDADGLIEKVIGIANDDFYEIYLYLVTDANIEINYMYTSYVDGFETNYMVSQIESYIDRYLSGNMNMDLKGF